MKRKASFILLVICCMGFSAFTAYSYLPEYLGRKMEKHLFKTFGKEIHFDEMSLNDSVRFNHQLYTVSNGDSLTGYAMISRALGCRIGGCEKPQEDSLAFEQFYYMTAFNRDRSIKRVRILEYSSNYGYQVANKGWLRQFENDRHFKVDQNIDGITGATISVKSLIKGVNQQIRIVDTIEK